MTALSSGEHVWKDIQLVPNPDWMSKDMASCMQKFLDTRTLLNVISSSRAMYHTFIPHLDTRLIYLFGLVFTNKPTHREVIEAILIESERFVTQCNELFASLNNIDTIDNIGTHLFRGWSYLLWSDVRFCIATDVDPLNTRKRLVELGCTIWKQHSKDIVNHISRVRKNPPLLRCVLSIARTLQTDYQAKDLASIALGALAVSEGNQPQYMAAFKAEWSSMNACEQAQAFLGLIAGSIPVEDLKALVNDFLSDKNLKWAMPIMQEACLHVVNQMIFEIELPMIVRVIDKMKMQGILVLFGEMAEASNNELVQLSISSLIQRIMDDSICNGRKPNTLEQLESMRQSLQKSIIVEVSCAWMKGETPDAIAIARMMNTTPDATDIALACDESQDDFTTIFTRFRQAFSRMPANEQAVYLHFFLMYQHIIKKLRWFCKNLL